MFSVHSHFLLTATVAADMQCKTPQCTRPRRCMEDGKGYYDFCSISCRDSGMTSSCMPHAIHAHSWCMTLLSLSAASGPCSLPGCTRPKYVDPANGRIHDYCGRRHAKEAQAKG